MEATLFAAVWLGAWMAGAIQGALGFGTTLVALPVIGLAMPLRQALPVCCLLAVVSNGLLAWRFLGQLRGRSLAFLLGASLPGMALGAWVLARAPENVLRVMLSLVILASVWRATRPRADQRPAGALWGTGAALLAGALGVCLGVNGPPIAAWVHRQPWSRDAMRATLGGYFLLAGVGIVGVQAWQGLVTAHVGLAFLLGLPALVFGLWCGVGICNRLGERHYFLAVQGFLAVIAVSLLARAAGALPG